MISEKFLEKVKGKLVHVDFIEKSGISFIEGVLDFDFDFDDHESKYGFIEITTDTDFIRIPVGDVRKIYLKE